MVSRLEKELSRFEFHIEQLSGSYDVEEIGKQIHVLKPKNYSNKDLGAGKDVAFTVSGVVHGNEYVGLEVINLFLDQLVKQHFSLTYPIGIFLGNTKAIYENKRFLESDLNRSFGVEEPSTWEEKRAKEILPLLQRSKFYLDFHQTGAASESPFYIFPYVKPAFEFARAMAPDLPLVTHWGKPFSKDGACTDEYVNKNGGAGVTIELGQAGFDLMQSALGLRYCLSGMNQAFYFLQNGSFGSNERFELAPIYTFSRVESFPSSGEGALVPGLKNMKQVLRSDKLGEWDGQPILAGEEGLLLFPKYITKDDVKRPSEFFRILRQVEESELPSEN